MARILVIDDDAQLRSLLRQMLERQNHEVHEAKDGVEGVQCAKDQEFDVVISDLIMPAKDGLIAIQEILQKRPGVKIIAMSGGTSGNAAWLPIAKKAGAVRVIKKPFAQKQFLETVTEVLASPW